MSLLKVADDIDSKEHLALSTLRPTALRVSSSIQERPSHEHWAHADEGMLHVPQTTRAIISVRSQQESIPLHPDNEVVRAVRSQVEDKWVQAPPNTPAVKGVRQQVEQGFSQPANHSQISRVRSIQEEFYPGINCLPDRTATRELSVPVGAKLGNSLQQGAPTATKMPSMPHSLTHRASTNSQPAHISPAGLPPVVAEASGEFQQDADSQSDPAPAAEPATTLDPQLLERAALVAAIRQHEESVWVKQPKLTPGIETVREGEEAGFKVPANSPQVDGIRKRISAFATVTSNTAINHIRQAEEGFRSADASSAASRSVSLQCEDPFAGYDSRVVSRPASRTVSRNVSLSAHTPGPASVRPAPT